MTRSARFTTGRRVLLMLVLSSMIVMTPDHAALADGAALAEDAGSADGAHCPGAATQPQYPALGAPPTVQVVRGSTSIAAPSGAECFGKSDSAAMWVTVASGFRTTDNPAAFVARFGAISQLLGVQYWSTTEQKWRPEHDVIYRLKLRSSQPGSIVVETANAEPIKQWGLTFYAVGGLHTLYFLNERAPGVWSYYSITRVLPNNFLAGGHEKSYINRAIALYRHYVSIPTNAEPPAAR